MGFAAGDARRVRRRRSRPTAARPSGRRRRPGSAGPPAAAGCRGSGRRTRSRSGRRLRWTCSCTASAEQGRRSCRSSRGRSLRSLRSDPQVSQIGGGGEHWLLVAPVAGVAPRRMQQDRHIAPWPATASGCGRAAADTTSGRSRRWRRRSTARGRKRKCSRKSRDGRGSWDALRPSRWRPCAPGRAGGGARVAHERWDPATTSEEPRHACSCGAGHGSQSNPGGPRGGVDDRARAGQAREKVAAKQREGSCASGIGEPAEPLEPVAPRARARGCTVRSWASPWPIRSSRWRRRASTGRTGRVARSGAGGEGSDARRRACSRWSIPSRRSREQGRDCTRPHPRWPVRPVAPVPVRHRQP